MSTLPPKTSRYPVLIVSLLILVLPPLSLLMICYYLSDKPRRPHCDPHEILPIQVRMNMGWNGVQCEDWESNYRYPSCLCNPKHKESFRLLIITIKTPQTRFFSLLNRESPPDLSTRWNRNDPKLTYNTESTHPIELSTIPSRHSL